MLLGLTRLDANVRGQNLSPTPQNRWIRYVLKYLNLFNPQEVKPGLRSHCNYIFLPILLTIQTAYDSIKENKIKEERVPPP